jgi:tetratricopeptide (TPR) repeat protein
VQAYTGLALAAHAQKNLRESLHYTIAAIEINPQYQPAYTLFNQLTRRALNKTPDSLLAKAPLEDRAILDRWLSILEASCHSAPDNSQLLAARGSVRMLRACQEAQIRALSNLSEIDLAIADFEKAVAADPENITARVLAGIAHLLAGQGRHPQAEHLSAACDQLREAVALDPRSGDTYRWLGYATAAAGRPQAAIASWQQALQLDSAHGSELVARIAKAGGSQPPQRATRNPLPQTGS